MFQGQGHPQLIYIAPSGRRITVNLPKCVKGGRKEVYEDETNLYRNIKGRTRYGKFRLRFKGEYAFGKVDQDTLDDLASVYNTSQEITWIPYSDFSMINYLCRIKIFPQPHQGVSKRDSLIVKVEAVETTNKIPTADNMLALVLMGRISKIYEIEE